MSQSFFLNQSDFIEETINAAFLYFDNKDYKNFHKVFHDLSEEQRVPVFRALVDRAYKKYYGLDAAFMVRKLCSNPSYGKLINQFPVLYDQCLPFMNLESLKTRVCMSFYEQDQMKDLEIDYTIRIFDSHGHVLKEKNDVISPGQTHTFDETNFTKGLPECHGTFSVSTSYKDLGSLRTYAYWYNDVGVTTTHEKGALRNRKLWTIFPTVISNDQYETYLMLYNVSQQEIVMELFLMNSETGENYQNLVKVSLPPRSSRMLAVSEVFQDLHGFLKDDSGSIWVRTSHEGNGMYYYFVLNKETGQWQIQHT